MAVSKKVRNAAFALASICSKTQTKMQESAIIVGANGGCPNFQSPKSHNSGMVADKPDVSCEYSKLRNWSMRPMISPSFIFLVTKIHQNRFRLGRRPRPYRGLTVLTMLPIPLLLEGRNWRLIPPSNRRYGKHCKCCEPHVGAGATPQPKSILVNFRTKLKIWCNFNLP